MGRKTPDHLCGSGYKVKVLLGKISKRIYLMLMVCPGFSKWGLGTGIKNLGPIVNFAAMLLQVFKSKIHRAKVTEANLNYVGSITIDEELMDAARIYPGEKLQVVNVNNGERLDTYAIKGRKGAGDICLNGAAARKAEVGDIVIIISYALMTPEEAQSFSPVTIYPDENNRLKP